MRRRSFIIRAVVMSVVGDAVFAEDHKRETSGQRAPAEWLGCESPELRQSLQHCQINARYITTRRLEKLDDFLPPLARDRTTICRYGRDVSVLFRLSSTVPLFVTQAGNPARIADLRVEREAASAPWGHKIPVPPEIAVDIPVSGFHGGCLYFMQRLFGPENGVGDEGVLESLVATTWKWRPIAAKLCDESTPGRKPAKQKDCEPANVAVAGDPDVGKLVIAAKFLSGRDIRALDEVFEKPCDAAECLLSDDDLYLVLRLHTRQPLGDKRILIRATIEVCGDEWPHAGLAFPAQSCDLDFIQIEDGIVYFVKRIERLDREWGKDGERKTLLSREWGTRVQRVMIKG